MLYLPKGRTNYMSGWRDSEGNWVRVSVGTSSKKRATEIASMLARLEADHEWETLSLLKRGGIPYHEAFAAWRNGNLGTLKQRAEQVDLSPMVEDWAKVRLGQGVTIANEYKRHVRRLMPEGAFYSTEDLTTPALQQWLDSLPFGPATRRKAAAGIASFTKYLVTRGVMPVDVSKLLERPTAPRPREKHLDTTQAIELIRSVPEPFQTALAIAYGTGVEAGVLVGLTRKDVVPERREIRARGTKTKGRDRVARIANWAWPWVEAHIANLVGNAKLFPGMDRHRISKVHHAAVERMGLVGYRLHDARHYWAVRAVRAGVPYKVVADQLGHSSIQMVASVYGVYAPTGAERDHWEEVASRADERRIA